MPTITLSTYELQCLIDTFWSSIENCPSEDEEGRTSDGALLDKLNQFQSDIPMVCTLTLSVMQ